MTCQRVENFEFMPCTLYESIRRRSIWPRARRVEKAPPTSILVPRAAQKVSGENRARVLVVAEVRKNDGKVLDHHHGRALLCVGRVAKTIGATYPANFASARRMRKQKTGKLSKN
jgi:hypothetical protein